MGGVKARVFPAFGARIFRLGAWLALPIKRLLIRVTIDADGEAGGGGGGTAASSAVVCCLDHDDDHEDDYENDSSPDGMSV